MFKAHCDSSISSLSTSHFLQCSSFSFSSIASAEVQRRSRSFIIHQTGKEPKKGGRRRRKKLNNELKSSASFQETFAVTFSNGRARTRDPAVIPGGRLIYKCIKIAKIPHHFYSWCFKQLSCRRKCWHAVNSQRASFFKTGIIKDQARLSRITRNSLRLLQALVGLNERPPQITLTTSTQTELSDTKVLQKMLQIH